MTGTLQDVQHISSADSRNNPPANLKLSPFLGWKPSFKLISSVGKKNKPIVIWKYVKIYSEGEKKKTHSEIDDLAEIFTF